jgi:hypothetical protein
VEKINNVTYQLIICIAKQKKPYKTQNIIIHIFNYTYGIMLNPLGMIGNIKIFFKDEICQFFNS